jgi:GNAT superfamily N-acetyltransferase
MGQNQPALVIERVSVDDARAQQLIRELDGDADEDVWNDGCFVVAEIDDVPVACGGYRMLDDHTAEIKRMYVAPSARGMKVGAAIISELESIAKSAGGQRMLVETWPRQLAGLEKFGFRRCPCRGESEQLSVSALSICVEKALPA